MLNPLDHPICLTSPQRLTPFSAWQEHIPFAMFLVDLLRPRVIVELGTHYGDSYCAFCQAVQELNLDTCCYAVDTWQGDPHAGFYDSKVLADLRAHHDPLYGSFSRLIQSTFDEALEHFGEGTIDLLHIDGYHVYSAVKHDFESWLSRMSSRGVVLLHDTNVREHDFGVRRFWEEVRPRYRHFEFVHGHGLGVMAVGKEQPKAYQEFLEASPDEVVRIRNFFHGLGYQLTLRVQKHRQDQQVLELDRQIKSMQTQRADKDQVMQALSEQVRQQTQVLRALGTQVAEKAQVVDQLQFQLAEHKQTREQLKNQLPEKEQTIQALSNRLTEQEAKLADKSQQASDLQKHLDSIMSSFAFRMARRLLSVADRLLPPRTRRRLLAKLAVKSITQPKAFIKSLKFSNVRKFFYHLRKTNTVELEQRVDTKLQNVHAEAIRPETEAVKKLIADIPNPHEIGSVKKIEELVFTETSSNPSVSIIIPVHNNWKYTYNCLKSILKNTESAKIKYEVILANDSSSDETMGMLQKIKGINVLYNETNLGYLRTCNKAAELAKGEYLVFLNSDTCVMKGWLAALVEAALRDERVGMVGSKVISKEGRLQEVGWIIGNDGWGYPIGRGDDPDTYKFNYLREVDCMSGSCFLIRQERFEKVGLFDDRFAPAYYEEFDLAFSIREHGYKIITQPKSVVVHYGSASYGAVTRDELSIRNHQKFVEKWNHILLNRSEEHCSYFGAKDRSQGKKVILFIDDKVPDHDKYAGSLTIYQYMKMMNDTGFKVIFMPDNLIKLEPYTSEIQQMGVEVIYGNFDFDSWMRNNSKYIDFVWLSRPNIAIKYVDVIKRHTRAKVLYYMHDLHYLRVLRKYEIEKSDQLLRESNRWKKIEFRLFDKVDVILTPSNVEKDIISGEFPHKQVEAIPAWIYEDISAVRTKSPFESKKDILFLGAFGHTPNIDGVLWFIDKVFPHITSKIPDVKFIVIGSEPPDSIKELASGNIVVTGHVKDLAPHFARARVFVAPLRYGAGVKGKLVMSMSHGLPFVTTTIGAEGLGMVDGESALIADDPKEFAAKVLELYNNKVLWERLSATCVEHVKRGFSKALVKEKFLKIINEEQCTVCGNLFAIPNRQSIENYRETMLCQACGAMRRQQDVARVLLSTVGSNASNLSQAMKDFEKLRIYLLESYGPIYEVLSKFPNFVYSEFLDDVPVGTTVNNIRCEDVQNLTFANESFDLVITQDIFEHVPEPEAGFKEIYRILKPNGHHIFTVPFNKSLPKSITRATFQGNKISHNLAPVYHRDKLRPEQGALVFTDFGLDLLKTLQQIGFTVSMYESMENYPGGYNIVFVCKK